MNQKPVAVGNIPLSFIAMVKDVVMISCSLAGLIGVSDAVILPSFPTVECSFCSFIASTTDLYDVMVCS